MGFVMIFFLPGFLSDEVVSYCFHVYWLRWLPGCSSMQLWKISHVEAKFGPIGCALKFRKMSLIGSLESGPVESAVLIVLICLSINTLDLG